MLNFWQIKMMFASLAILCYIGFSALNPKSVKAKIHSTAAVSLEVSVHISIGVDGVGVKVWKQASITLLVFEKRKYRRGSLHSNAARK